MNAHARRTDPPTSVQAAEALQHLARERQRILTAFTTHGDMTDSELERHALEQHWPYAGNRYYYRRRRSDLKAMGLITATDHRRPNERGNSETVWTLTIRKDTTMKTGQPASLDEGNIIFRRLDNTQWAIEGVNLTPGETVIVYTRDGEARDVIVGQILETNHGVDTATFEWANHPDPAVIADGTVIFHSLGEGEWAIRGLDLAQGEEVEVTTKAGDTRTVIVADIIDIDDNLVTARFEWADTPNDDLITFASNPHGDGYLIRGTNLTPGTTVPVVKKSGKPVRVTIDQIVDEDGDWQYATFTWPNKIR